MSISTHILDTAAGRPAPNVPVHLARLGPDAQWHPLGHSLTDPDGRCRFPDTQPLTPGTYRIHFDTAAHYAAESLTGLYPFIEIAFTVAPGQTHYHIPLLLTANGYTTYRGS